MLRLVAFAFVAIPSAASANAVMLNCVIATQNDGPLQMNVQLNEAGGSVSYSFPHSGISVTKRAIFAPDRVTFGSFAISRTNLSIDRINNGEFDQRVFKLPPVEHGTCAIDSRKRAF